LLWGHDDRITREPGHLFLRCADCGRQSAGWDLDPDAGTIVRADVGRREARVAVVGSVLALTPR
jgi:hypothetical protein